MQYKRLTSSPAKSRCVEDRRHEGTIINFVDNRQSFWSLRNARWPRAVRSERNTSKSMSSRTTKPRTVIPTSGGKTPTGPRAARLERAIALDKLMHMVQAAESVAWLHTEMKIIHRI